MNSIMGYVYTLVLFSLVVTILEMLLPNGNSKKYVRLVSGFILIILIVAPIINIFNGENDLIEEVVKEIDNIDFSDDTNNEGLKLAYLSEVFEECVKDDVTKRVGNLGYNAENVKIKYNINDKNEFEKITYMEFEICEKKEKVETGKIAMVIPVAINNSEKPIVLEQGDKQKILNELSNAYSINKNSINILEKME